MRIISTVLGATALMFAASAVASEMSNPYDGGAYTAQGESFADENAADAPLPSRFTFSQGFGTLGSETQAMVRVSPSLDLRGSFSYLALDRTADVDSVAYQGAFSSTALGAFVDWRPFNEWLTFSLGAYVGDRGATLRATPATATQIGAVTYTPAEIGALNGGIDLGDVSPYLGMSADMKYAEGSKWGLRFTAGVIFNEVTTRLAATGGLLENDPAFQAQVAAERARLQEEAEALKIYPVASLHMTYRY